MGQRVKRFKTQVSPEQITQAIIRVWKKLFNTDPSKDQVMLLLSQISVETGHGKSMYNYNVGNITTDGKSYDFFDDLETSEQVKPGVFKKMNLKYIAYKSLDEGIENYINFLKKRPGSWQHIENPDPEKYSKALKKDKYYTADESLYTRNLKGVFSLYSKKDFEKMKSGDPQKPETSEVAKKDTGDTSKKSLPTSTSDEFEEDLPKVETSPKAIQPSSVAKSESETTAKKSEVALKKLDQILNLYNAASLQLDRKKISKILPKNNILISVSSNDKIKSIEFCRVLCAALDEELFSESYIHTDNDSVEIQCDISGPKNICSLAVKEITNLVLNAFNKATYKIGSSNINADFLNKKSSCKMISAETLDKNYTKFLLKFKEG